MPKCSDCIERSSMCHFVCFVSPSADVNPMKHPMFQHKAQLTAQATTANHVRHVLFLFEQSFRDVLLLKPWFKTSSTFSFGGMSQKSCPCLILFWSYDAQWMCSAFCSIWNPNSDKQKTNVNWIILQIIWLERLRDHGFAPPFEHVFNFVHAMQISSCLCHCSVGYQLIQGRNMKNTLSRFQATYLIFESHAFLCSVWLLQMKNMFSVGIECSLLLAVLRHPVLLLLQFSCLPNMLMKQSDGVHQTNHNVCLHQRFLLNPHQLCHGCLSFNNCVNWDMKDFCFQSLKDLGWLLAAASGPIW